MHNSNLLRAPSPNYQCKLLLPLRYAKRWPQVYPRVEVSNLACPKNRPNFRTRLFEITRVLVRFDHVARFIVNADHNAM